MTGDDIINNALRLMGGVYLANPLTTYEDTLNYVLYDFWMDGLFASQPARITDFTLPLSLPPEYSVAITYILAVTLADRFAGPLVFGTHAIADRCRQHLRAQALKFEVEAIVLMPPLYAPSAQDLEMIALLMEAKTELAAQLEALRLAA